MEILVGLALIASMFYFFIKNKDKKNKDNEAAELDFIEHDIEHIYNLYKKEIDNTTGKHYLDFYWEDFLRNLFNPNQSFNFPRELLQKFNELKTWRHELPLIREKNNDKYIQNFFENKKYFFENIEGNPLDNQQIAAIIKDEICNLVIAGAGSGKTTTIIGKIKYLIDEVGVNPDEILAICFNNSAAKELKERIKNQGYNVEAFTFHKLGLDIIREFDSTSKIFNEENIDKVLEECINQEKENNENIIFFFSYYLNQSERDEFKVTDLEKYQKEIENVALITLKGEYVRSYEEVLIANYLFKNNIDYEYEKFYEIPESMKTKYYESFFRQNSIFYRPDFYLPKYDIYIEHFGIDEKGNVPKFWTLDNPNAQEKYLSGIKWKRNLHKIMKTTLVETYSHYKKNGILETKLKEILTEKGVEFKALTDEELLEKIKNSKSGVMYSKFINLLKNFVNYTKQNDINKNYMKNNLSYFEDGYSRARADLFIKIVLKSLKSYQSYLKNNHEIDFADMIVKAKELLKNKCVKRAYKYIIIDEFQDISKNRFGLIEEIINKNKGKLFCVGDDWQSIYGFAGSDLNLFLNINKKMPFGIQSFIEKTYRYPQSIANLAGTFIMKNNQQLKKNISSLKDDTKENNKAYEALYYEKNKEDFKTKHKAGGELLRKKLLKLPGGSTVLLLSRYNFEKNQFLGDELVEIADYNGINIKYKKRPDLKISFKTVHKSKGLQADYVFILNNRNGLRDGFPSKIEDDELYMLIKGYNEEKYEFSEERRLYYVAMTRAKKKVIFIVCSDEKSSFIKEIEPNWNKTIKNTCPECGAKEFIINNEDFYCRSCQTKIEIKDMSPNRNCPRCGSELEYSKKNKLFIKCSGFPKCDYLEFFN